MTPHTKTLNVRVTLGQYERLEELVAQGAYTSKSEYIRELLRNSLDEFSRYLREKSILDRRLMVPLEEFGKSQGLE